MVDASKAAHNMNTFLSHMNNVTFDLKNTDYRPIKNIGSGAYGVVCSAEHKVTGDKVSREEVIKELCILEHSKVFESLEIINNRVNIL